MSKTEIGHGWKGAVALFPLTIPFIIDHYQGPVIRVDKLFVDKGVINLFIDVHEAAGPARCPVANGDFQKIGIEVGDKVRASYVLENPFKELSDSDRLPTADRLKVFRQAVITAKTIEDVVAAAGDSLR